MPDTMTAILGGTALDWEAREVRSRTGGPYTALFAAAWIVSSRSSTTA
jgi:hypothetical protein